MAIHIDIEYHDVVAPTAFYPKQNPVKIATGPSGGLGGGGWSVDTWATVVQIWVAKSDGTWESQVAAPLGGNIPFNMTTQTTTTSAQGIWTNSTTIYTAFWEYYKKISGVWTLVFSGTTGVNGNKTVKETFASGDNVRYRARYTSGGVDGDWSQWDTAIIPF